MGKKQKALFWNTYALFWFYAPVIKLAPQKKLIPYLQRQLQRVVTEEDSSLSTTEIKNMVSVTLKYIPNPFNTCLIRSFIMALIMKKNNLTGTLVFALKKDTIKGLQAHAWVNDAKTLLTTNQRNNTFHPIFSLSY